MLFISIVYYYLLLLEYVLFIFYWFVTYISCTKQNKWFGCLLNDNLLHYKKQQN